MANTNFDFSSFDNGDDAIVNRRFARRGFVNTVSERSAIASLVASEPIENEKPETVGMSREQIMRSFGYVRNDAGKWVAI
jgi:hypothetical protein